MSNFVDDLTDLPGPKTQVEPIPEGEEDNALSADDYNEVRQASYDMRGAILDLRDDLGAGVVPTSRLINTNAPIAGGGDLSIDRTLSLNDDGVTDAKLRNSAALSVIGRSANSTGDPADIAAGSDGDVLRRSGTALGFGAIPESSVTGLTTDLAAKTPTSRTLSGTSPIRIGGGASGDLSADRTISVLDNSTSDKGVVAVAPNDTTKFWRGDASWAVPGVLGAGSLSIAEAAAPSTLNLTTEGTNDWFAIIAVNRPKTFQTTALNAKATGGGWLSDSFEWIHAGTNASLSTFSGQNPSKTSTGSDGTSTAALASNTVGTFLSITNATATGFGFRIRVPAINAQRVLRIYTGQYSCEITCSARLEDGSASPVTASHSEAAGAAANRKFTITYQSAVPCDLIVTVLVTTNNHDGANTLNMGFSCATLATS